MGRVCTCALARGCSVVSVHTPIREGQCSIEIVMYHLSSLENTLAIYFFSRFLIVLGEDRANH